MLIVSPLLNIFPAGSRFHHHLHTRKYLIQFW